ncbi:hypothetical protein [Streptomyces thermodiastaticus]|uniref:hypothetical protein n=1 Tax=Streptomyces thermodiastaticus TaxID=44061 RepID=UPI00167AF052|nr:hypothetical protein [Streptomyces thermodiastaticus]MCE7553196.1 hypothetical protein [Streptomyces thermodiastaticus]GHF92184.1 hypothetical protein GCM10018787_46230 [Streptomyces thermodiastaticus]
MLVLVAGLAYALKVPPFKKRGEIKAYQVCASLGDEKRAASILTDVLPNEPSYSFRENPMQVNIGQAAHSFHSDCFVYGDGKQLLVVTTDSAEYDDSADWVEEAVGDLVPVKSLKPFTSGDRAVASDKVAAIYVPCLSNGIVRHLSVVAWLKRKNDASSQTIQDGLIDLAKNTARYSHSKAQCDADAKL